MLLKIVNGKLRYVRTKASLPDTLSDIQSTTGATASEAGISDARATDPQAVADQRDQLANDLLAMLESSEVIGYSTEPNIHNYPTHMVIDKDMLMQRAVIYLAERDQRILRHGIRLGREAK